MAWHWAALESAQAEGKSELRVNTGIHGITGSCQTGPWSKVGKGCVKTTRTHTLVLLSQPAGGSESQQSSL